jgi:hypothetical protein
MELEPKPKFTTLKVMFYSTFDIYQMIKKTRVCVHISVWMGDLNKVLNNGRGHGRGRVKVFAISAVMDVAIPITVFAV